MTKYNSGDILYYVNPFIFTIEMVKINFCVKEEDGQLYYIDEVGAYLHEQDLFNKLEDAKEDALNKLDKFYDECTNEILHFIPTYNQREENETDFC